MPIRNAPVATHAGCTNICCSGYVFAEEATNLPSPNLDNEIHPILRRWIKNNPTTLEADAVDQPFRALTNMVHSEDALQTFHTVLFGNRRALPRQGNDAVQWEFHDEDWDLNEEQRAKTIAALDEVADFIDLRLSSSNGTSFCEPGRKIKKHELFAGHRVTIHLEKRLYTDASKSAHDDRVDEISRTWDYFSLIRTLLHELAHAVVKVRWGHHEQGANAFFDTCGIAEEGFELENRLFGGIIEQNSGSPELLHKGQKEEFYYYDGKPTYLNGLLEIYDYPYLAKVEEYDTHGLSINMFEDRTPEISVRWRLHIRYLHAYFQRDFWKQGFFDKPGPDALHPAKTIGYRYKAIGGGLAAPYNPTNDNDTNTAVPDGYEVDALGVIRPRAELTTPESKQKQDARTDSALAFNPRRLTPENQTSLADHMDIDSDPVIDTGDEMDIDEAVPSRIMKTKIESKHLKWNMQDGLHGDLVGMSKNRSWLKKEQAAEDQQSVTAGISRALAVKKEEPIAPLNWHK